jgi:hypothetical protein
MKGVNNFELVRKLLKFESKDQFYFIELIQRKKDDESLSVNNRLVKYYMIRSLEHFDKVKDEIIQISHATNSRVYINLNRRSYKKITVELLKLCAQYISDENYLGVNSAVSSVCGQYRTETEPTWIIDVDEVIRPNSNYVKEIISYVENECEPVGNKFKTIIPTINGVHIIVPPFNVQRFKIKYPNIDVHKNNPTLLYYNETRN